MKKSVVLFLALALALALVSSACAEEALYVRTLPQYTYMSATLLTPESYPEVRIFPEYAYSLFRSYDKREPVFLCFPGPDNAQAESFDSNEAAYLDADNAIQYAYYVRESDSFEEFINKAEQDEFILLDGSDGTAAYIEPQSCRAHGMIATKDFGKSSKLIIDLRMDRLDSKMPQDKLVEELSAAILAEVERVKTQMRYETFAPHWASDRFAGMKLLDYDCINLVELDFPTLTLKGREDGATADASMIVTSVDGKRLEGFYVVGDDRYLKLSVEFDSSSFAAYEVENKEEGASIEKLQDGTEIPIYLSYVNEDGVLNWCASIPLEGMEEFGTPCNLDLDFDGEGVTWADKAACLEVVERFAENCRVVPVDDDPYVPRAQEEVAQPAEAEPQAVAEAEGGVEGEWICANCEASNSGNFCSNCGAAKPESAEWTCPGCGQVNEGNFCPNCGTAKP